MTRTRFLIAAAALLAASAQAAPPPADDAARVTRLADDYVAAYVHRFPEQTVFAGMEAPGFERLFDNSAAADKAWKKREDAWWHALSEIDGKALVGRPEWITYGFVREALYGSRALRACRLELWPVSQMNGWQAFLPDLLGAMPVETPQARARIAKVLASLPGYLGTERANLERGLKLGWSTPRHNVELVIAQLDGLIDVPLAQSPLYGPAERSGDAAFKIQWEKLLSDAVLPAVRQYREYLKGGYLAKARATVGVSALPDGAACYAASLRAYTGLDTAPKAMFEQGERAVSARQAKARALMQKVYGSSDLSTLRATLEQDKNNHFETRAQVQAFSQEAIDRATLALPKFFGLVPKAKVRIEPIPAFDEEHGVPHYVPASADGARPGTYAISLYQPEKQNRAQLEAVAFHETVPGHHMQAAIAQERPQAHPITRLLWNSGYGEGWAVYAEELADEMGLFSSDLERLGEYVQLPTGMVCDPGVHAMGWSRDQAIEYFIKMRPDYSPERAASQVDRIIVTPGQLTTYFAGALEIRALRELAEAKLGTRFDLRAFHDRVLEDGAVTLPMLREKIERWVAAESK